MHEIFECVRKPSTWKSHVLEGFIQEDELIDQVTCLWNIYLPQHEEIVCVGLVRPVNYVHFWIMVHNDKLSTGRNSNIPIGKQW